MRLFILAAGLLASVSVTHALFWKVGSSSSSRQQHSHQPLSDANEYSHHGSGGGEDSGGEDDIWHGNARNPYKYMPMSQSTEGEEVELQHYQQPPPSFRGASSSSSFGDPNIPLLDAGASTERDPHAWYRQQGSSYDYAPQEPSVFSAYHPQQEMGISESLPQYDLPPDYSSSAYGMSAGMGTLNLMDGGDASAMPLRRIRTGEGEGGDGVGSSGVGGAGGSATARVRGSKSRGHRDEGSERQLPQTARVRRPRRETDEVEATPSTARASPAAITERAPRGRRINERQQLAETRAWLLQQWKARGMKFSMHPQILAQQVAEIKIMNPERIRQICLVSTNVMDEAKAADEDYLFDYHTWADVYQDRLHAIRIKYTKQGIDKDSDEMKALLLAEYKTTKAKHCASLADPASEAWDREYAREVWETFVKNRLQDQLDAGAELNLALIAQASWNYEEYGVIAHTDAIKYINKFLRCVMGVTPTQLSELRTMQEALRPPTKKTRGGRSRQA